MPSQLGEFDFISVLISIVVGRAVTNLLAGAGRAIYRRRTTPLDEAHFAVTHLVLVRCYFASGA